MNRALYSGVAGLKAHQTKMDVIGNNIANVNTYGYKSQRAVFSDVYYQAVRSATAGTSSKGGTNPSSVGYGSRLAAIQADMSQSSTQSTGYGLDAAIAGEGFFQVMDSDGNIFYTKAGVLDYDANGYLTDVNGNFVLGSSKADGSAGSEKIKLDNLGSVASKTSRATVKINGIEYTMTSSSSTESGNVTLSLGSSDDLPAGQKATATISSTGAITVKLSSTEKFANLTELNAAINSAITEANGGKRHAAGTFTISAPDAAKKFPTGGLTGKEICGTDYSVQDGTITGDDIFGGLMIVNGTSSDFTGSGTVTSSDFTATYTAANGDEPAYWTIRMKAGDKTYTGILKDGELAKSLLLKSADVNSAAINGIAYEVNSANATDGNVTLAMTSSSALPAGTKATATISDTGAISVTLNSTEKFASLAELNSAINAAITAANGGKQIAAGALTLTAPDAASKFSGGLTGAEICGTDYSAQDGTVKGDSIFNGLMTIIGTSGDFTGSGTVGPSDFTAAYTAADGEEPACWTVSIKVGGKTYSGEVKDGEYVNPLQLKSADGDYLEAYNPGFDQFSALAGDADSDGVPDATTLNALDAGESLSVTPASASKQLGLSSVVFGVTSGTDGGYIEVSNPGFDQLVALAGDADSDGVPDAATISALETGKSLSVSPATQSNDLGLSAISFNLTGGTEGGSVTLDQLTSIAIGSDGVISVTHPDLGTVSAGKISLANFANPSGLQLQGSNYYAATANSGEAILCDPGSDGTGELLSNTLELSNVDLSSEFADMITTQRGFQANSRIITVSDTMLEELINLKR